MTAVNNWGRFREWDFVVCKDLMMLAELVEKYGYVEDYARPVPRLRKTSETSY